MAIFIQNRQRTVPLRTVLIKKRLQRLMQYLGCPDAELSILFTNDQTIRTLNRIYRHKDTPTNVLAFPQTPSPRTELGIRLLGDVVVSLPMAAREARATRQALEDHVTFLLVHGILHLLGYDHEHSTQDRRRMQQRERALWRRIRAAERAEAPQGPRPKSTRRNVGDVPA